ncbi:MAG: helix-turn-helix transcriptional regulator [Bacilli bacterium]|nr:helix-turn-helix transcriptional regulator [Bacilli bacterium]
MNKLKELREERGYTIRSLSAVIDIHYNTISSYENETRDLNTNALKKFATFFEVTIDYLLCYSGYYVFVNYHNIMLKVNEDDYKLLYKEGFIYFNEGKRCVSLNKLIGLDNDNDISDLIIDLYRHKRVDELFDKKDRAILENNNDVVEIVLDKNFIEFMKKSIAL